MAQRGSANVWSSLKTCCSGTDGTVVNLAGLVRAIDRARTIVSKQGNPLPVATLSLADSTAVCFRLTLWDDKAIESSAIDVGNVVVATGVLLRAYRDQPGGSTMRTSIIDIVSSRDQIARFEQHDVGKVGAIRHVWEWATATHRVLMQSKPSTSASTAASGSKRKARELAGGDESDDEPRRLRDVKDGMKVTVICRIYPWQTLAHSAPVARGNRVLALLDDGQSLPMALTIWGPQCGSKLYDLLALRGQWYHCSGLVAKVDEDVGAIGLHTQEKTQFRPHVGWVAETGTGTQSDKQNQHQQPVPCKARGYDGDDTSVAVPHCLSLNVLLQPFGPAVVRFTTIIQSIVFPDMQGQKTNLKQLLHLGCGRCLSSLQRSGTGALHCPLCPSPSKRDDVGTAYRWLWKPAWILVMDCPRLEPSIINEAAMEKDRSEQKETAPPAVSQSQALEVSGSCAVSLSCDDDVLSCLLLAPAESVAKEIGLDSDPMESTSRLHPAGMSGWASGVVDAVSMLNHGDVVAEVVVAAHITTDGNAMRRVLQVSLL